MLASIESRVDRLILLDRNRGKGAALKAGFAAASGDIVVIQDADLEYDPQDFLALLEPIVRAEADLVLGSRMNGAKPQRAYYFWHYVGNEIVTYVARVLYNTTPSDVYTCYKMFRRACLDNVRFDSDGFEFDAEMRHSSSMKCPSRTTAVRTPRARRFDGTTQGRFCGTS